MIVLASIKRTTLTTLSQFEGISIDGRPVYVRYKWGILTATLAEEEIFFAEHGHRYGSDIGWSEIEAQTGMRCVGTVEDWAA